MSAEAVAAEALVSALLQRRMPGPGTVIVEQHLRFSGAMAVGDQIAGTLTVQEKIADGHRIVFGVHVTNGGADLITGTVTVVAPTEPIAYSDMATPQIVLRHNDAFVHLLERCKDIPAVRCAVVHPCDRDSLLGPLEAAKRGLIEPVLVGPEAKIRAVAAEHGADLRSARWPPSTAPTSPASASCPPNTATPRPTRRWRWPVPARCRR